MRAWYPGLRALSPSLHITKFDAILQDLLYRDHHPDIPGICSAEGCTRAANTRCRECRQAAPVCVECCVIQHRNHPLHWIDLWNGRFFERRDLSQLGFIIYLGHGGHPCHQRASNSKPINFVVVHENGVHQCKIEYCQCANRPELLSQLIRADYFPATLIRTETLFTTELLEDFILDYEISKKSTQDYLRRIVRRTNGAFPKDVKVSTIFGRISSDLYALPRIATPT